MLDLLNVGHSAVFLCHGETSLLSRNVLVLQNTDHLQDSRNEGLEIGLELSFKVGGFGAYGVLILVRL